MIASARAKTTYRVCFTANSPLIGGGNQVLLQLCKSLPAAGFHPTVLCPDSGQMEAACIAAGVDVHVRRLPRITLRSPFATVGNVGWLTTFLSRGGFHIIHANDIFGARSVSVAARLLRIPVICHIHYPPTEDGVNWAFRCVPKPNCFLFCSRSVQDEIGPAIRAACPAAIQHVVLNATECDVQSPRGQNEYRKTRIGIVANLNRVKGHLDFFEMARLLTDKGLDAEYWVVGGNTNEPDYASSLERTVEAMNLASRVSFLGHQTNVRDVLESIDIVVCPSHHEPFGLCVIEAMAAGKPVVASRVGGIPEIISDERYGVLVEPRSPREFADAVYRIASDKELCNRMGASARAHIETNFGTTRFVNEVVNVYQSQIGYG